MTDDRTSDRDVNRAIRSWLHVDRHEDASRIAGAVLDHVEATPRRRATWWSARRFPTMNKFLAIGLGTAAVVVALLVGAQLFGSSGSVGGPGGEPTPTAEATATPEPTVTAEPPPTPFVLEHPSGDGPAITVTSGLGWSGDDGTIIGNNGGEPPDGAAIIGPFFGEFYVYGDPCRWSTTTPETPATTVDEVVADLTGQALRDASEPVDITVEGYAGKSITLHVPDDAVFSECDEGLFASWEGGGTPLSDGPARHHQGPGQTDELWILDVDGELIVMDAMYGAETSAEHLDELHAILESMTFDR